MMATPYRILFVLAVLLFVGMVKGVPLRQKRASAKSEKGCGLNSYGNQRKPEDGSWYEKDGKLQCTCDYKSQFLQEKDTKSNDADNLVRHCILFGCRVPKTNETVPMFSSRPEGYRVEPEEVVEDEAAGDSEEVDRTETKDSEDTKDNGSDEKYPQEAEKPEDGDEDEDSTKGIDTRETRTPSFNSTSKAGTGDVTAETGTIGLTNETNSPDQTRATGATNVTDETGATGEIEAVGGVSDEDEESQENLNSTGADEESQEDLDATVTDTTPDVEIEPPQIGDQDNAESAPSRRKRAEPKCVCLPGPDTKVEPGLTIFHWECDTADLYWENTPFY